MGQNVTQKLIASHLVDGRMQAGTAIGLRIDQTLTQDATGTLVMLELEAMNLQPEQMLLNVNMLVLPAPAEEPVELVKGPNIASLPPFEPLPETLQGPVLLKLGDNISTDEILPAGDAVLPLRSNIYRAFWRGA